MRILFLINFYPPYELGGQGRSCEYVVKALKKRGHQAIVLTSRHGIKNGADTAEGIYRRLFLEMELEPWRNSLIFFRRQRREQCNLQYFEEAAHNFKPDVIFIWGMWNLPWSLPAFAEARFPDRVAYRFGDYWPTLPSQHELYWRRPGRRWFTELPKRPLKHFALTELANDGDRPKLKFERTMCISGAMRDVLVEAGVPVHDARIIHNGIDADRYLAPDRQARPLDAMNVLKFLFAGRLTQEKGVETAIEAMARLVSVHEVRNVSLTMVGSGAPDYEHYLRNLVKRNEVNDHVEFLGRVPAESMPALYRDYDVLIFPSVWTEPFGLVVLEAMASGLAIVASRSGGPGEVIEEGRSGLLFSAGNAVDLAEKMACLVADDDLRQRLARAGRRAVLERFTLERMADDIEGFLQAIVEEVR